MRRLRHRERVFWQTLCCSVVNKVAFHARMQTPIARYESVESGVDWCSRWLSFQVRIKPPSKKLAAVFDIDDTLITRDEHLIEPTRALLEQCVAMRVTPFFITARSERGREYTEEQLQRMRINVHKRLFMHPTKSDASHAGRQKHSARASIGSHGYTIILNAGDAIHDHFSPTPHAARQTLHPGAVYVFVSDDGVAHLKLPG